MLTYNRVTLRPMTFPRLALLATACLLASAGCSHFDYAVPTAYSDIQLLPLESQQSSHARAVSPSAPYRVVGYSASKGKMLATMWVLESSQSKVQQGLALQTVSGHSSQALAVNDRGDVAGFEIAEDGRQMAIAWRSGKRIVLHEQIEKQPTLNGQPIIWSRATFVDESGNVAGVLLTAEKKLMIFRIEGDSTQIFALENASDETDISVFNPESGQGIGNITTAAKSPRAVAFDIDSSESNSVPLVPIGESDEFSFSRAHDQNRDGHIVGEIRQESGVDRAFLSVKGRYRNLGVIRGAQSSSAYALNNKTKIVGKSVFSDGRERAFIWAPGYTMRSLNSLASAGEFRELSNAFDINDRDVIVGDGSLMNRTIAFALTPGASDEKIRISCMTKAPSTAKQFDEVSVKIVCTNVSTQAVDDFIVEADLPERTELVSVSNRGGSLPPTSSAPNGRLKWAKKGLDASKTAEFSFTVLPMKSGTLKFKGTVIVPNIETNEFISSTVTRIETVQNTKLVKLLGTPSCTNQTAGSVLDFEVLPLGFEPTEVALEMGGSIVAKDSDAPFAFSLENLPQGVHCVSVVATSSMGDSITSAPQCNFVVKDNEDAVAFRPVELSSGEGELSHVLGINTVGDAVGFVRGRDSKTRAALWFSDDDVSGVVNPTLLPTDGFCGEGHSKSSIARDINSAGTIVGVCGPVWKQKSFLWKQGRFRAISIDGQNVRVTGINDAEQVVGELGGNGSQSSAFTGSFDPQGVFTLQDLPGLGQGAFASAQSINNFGIVVGRSHDLQNHAILWKHRTPQEVLGVGVLSRSRDISNNHSPYVVGEFSNGTTKHAFLWSQDAGLVDIHNTELGFSSEASSVNKYGQVVGSYSENLKNPKRRAFLRTCQRTFDLNDLIPEDSGWILHEAVGINAKGNIVGNGTYKGSKKAFILSR